MIYAIGDSHICFIAGLYHYQVNPPYPAIYGNDKYKLIRKAKKITAYATSDTIEHIKNIIKEQNITDDDYIIFSYGEVDIRFYMSKYENTLHDAIKSYRDFLLAMPRQRIVFAPTVQLGSETLDKFCVLFREQLFEMCDSIGVPIIDLRKYICCRLDGRPNSKYFDDDKIHLSFECRKFFEKELKDVMGGM